MHPSDLLEQLLDIARAAGLEVRQTRAGLTGEGDLPPHSGVCRLRGRVFVVLVVSDGIEERIDVLAAALATHARDHLESRYLPPAIRDRLPPGFGADFSGA